MTRYLCLFLLGGCTGHFDFHNVSEDNEGRYTKFFGGPLSAVDWDDHLELDWSTSRGVRSWEVRVAVPYALVVEGTLTEEDFGGSACVRTIAGCGLDAMALTRGTLTFSQVQGGTSCAEGLEMRVRWDLAFGVEDSETEPWGAGRGSVPISLCID